MAPVENRLQLEAEVLKLGKSINKGMKAEIIMLYRNMHTCVQSTSRRGKVEEKEVMALSEAEWGD